MDSEADHDQQVLRGIGPGLPTPATALAADMGDGSLFLHDWRDGSSADLAAADAIPLRRAPGAAFGSEQPVAVAASDKGNP